MRNDTQCSAASVWEKKGTRATIEAKESFMILVVGIFYRLFGKDFCLK